jgi:DNA-binding GntR family transcriptional regulator
MGSSASVFRKAAPRTAAAGAPKNDHPSRSERVYQKLRDAIQQRQLEPGQRVTELEVAAWLDVSRTPVRDALRRLESEGMLVFEPRTGLVVASITREAMLELYVMREVLEGTAARLCARQASDSEIMALEELVKREARLGENYGTLVQHNKLFHEAVHRGAHNRYLEKSLSAVNDSMSLLGESQMLIPERAAEARIEHAAIFEAIKNRDPDAAEQTARRHIGSAQRQRLKRLFPESE